MYAESPTSEFVRGPHSWANSVPACRDEQVPGEAEVPRTNCADREVMLGSLYVLAHPVRPAVRLFPVQVWNSPSCRPDAWPA